MQSQGLQLLILDADGVFMNEMPYWHTALAAALDFVGLRLRRQAEWDAFARVAFVEQRIQRVTKARGCNSNWDLTALLACVLQDDATRAVVADALDRHDYTLAAQALRAAGDARWTGAPATGHLLGGFGIEKGGPLFAAAVQRFQEVFSGSCDVGWDYPKQQLAGEPARLKQALADLRAGGWMLAVCTSRMRDETVEPMKSLGISPFFDMHRIVTQSDTLEGQERTGQKPLGKPHWFPLAVSVCGFEQAVAAARNGGMLHQPPGTFAYVGDASADFGSVCAARERGLTLDYVHIDSGVTDSALLEEIRAAPGTVAVVADLANVAAILRERRS